MRRTAILLTVLSVAAAVTGQVRVIGSSPAVKAATKRSVAALAQAGLKQLAPFFPGTPNQPIRFVVHADEKAVHPEVLSSLHPGVPGFARLQQNEIHIVMSAIRVDPPNDLKTTVNHELVHILLDQFVGRNGFFVARWFHEGLAQDLAGGGYLGVQEEDLIYRVHARTYIPFRELEKRFPKDSPDRLALAYGQSYSFVAYLRRELGLEIMLAAARDCGPERLFRAALSIRIGKGLTVYEDLWLDYLRHGSGAGFRVILTNCFSITLLILVGPLLALAVARRRNREESIKQVLGEQDDVEDEARVREFEDEELADEDDDVDWDDWDVDPEDPEWEGRPDPER